jgi:hypothetical protein
VSQRLQSWLPAARRLLRSSSERGSPPSDPRHVLQRSKDVVRALTRADLFPASYKDRCYCSSKANNDMLDDILLNIDSLKDELVRRRLSSRHIWYERFMFDADHSADDALFATKCGFAGWARSSPCRSTPPPDHSVRKDDIIVAPRGASLPWVLRETDVAGEYKLITDCGVYGIMQGELMSLVESGQLQTQRYTLV